MSERLTDERLAEIRGAHNAWWRCPDTDEDGQVHSLLLHVDAQQSEIDRLAAQVAALRKALEVSEAQFNAESANVFGHARLQVDMNRLVVTEQVRRALADTEAAAREHDRKLRLEGARELVKLAIEQHFNLTDEYAYAQAPDFWMDRLREALAVQEKRADMEAEKA